MNLKERAIAAYREAQKSEEAWRDKDAVQFCQRARRWLANAFDCPLTAFELVPGTDSEATGSIDSAEIRVCIRYGKFCIDVKALCPKCNAPVWHRTDAQLGGLGRVLAGEGTRLAERCEGCPRLLPEPTAEIRLARAFVDMVCDVVDDR